MSKSGSPTLPLSRPNTLIEGWEELPASPTDWREGRQVGPFRLKRPLGEGGMGVVWLAEQLEPLQREVAIKVMRQERRGALDEVFFEVERQALARLSHRAIAQIHDAGRLPDGSLFFAMEYVPGVPLDQFVREQHPSPTELARLFIEICLGVQHAHQRGLIHRDLKPGNLLVQRVDGSPQPKIIDFGVATSVSAGAGAIMVAGTRPYMSPEQRTPDANGIDARTDVYALGAVLAECLYLLAGIEGDEQAFDSTILRQGLTASLRRPLPGADVAPTRSPQQLHALPAELRAIAVRAMAQDPEQRYTSAAALGEDLGRWLAHQPVQAMGEGRWYSVRCAMRRNALLSTMVIGAVLALGVFAFAMAQQASRIAREAERANQALEELQAVTLFQTDQLQGINAQLLGQQLLEDIRTRHRAQLAERGASAGEIESAEKALATELAAVNFVDVARSSLYRGIFERALSNIHERFSDRPAIQAELLQSSSMALRDLGLLEQARAPQEEALALRRKHFGNVHERTALSLNESGVLSQYLGKLDEAEAFFREAMEIGIATRGAKHIDTVRSIGNLAAILQAVRKFEEAEPLFRRALALHDEALGPEDPATISVRTNYAVMKYTMGDFTAAETGFREVLAVQRRLGQADQPYLSTLNNLASTTNLLGKSAEAESLYRETVDLGQRILGEEHPNVLRYLASLANVLDVQGRYDEAEPLLRKVLASRRRVLGDMHPHTLRSEQYLGRFLLERGRVNEADPMIRHAAAMAWKVAEDDADRFHAQLDLAELLRRKGEPAAAVALLRTHENAIRSTFTGSFVFRVAGALTTLGLALEALGGDQNMADAEAALEEAYAILLKRRGAGHDGTRRIAGYLAAHFAARELAQPGAGHTASAAEWRRRQSAE